MNSSVQILPLILALAIPLAGCTTSSSQSLALQRVGSAPDHLPGAPAEGLLLVNPDWLPLTSLDDPDMSVRASYKILSSDGALYRKVRVWGSEHHPEPMASRRRRLSRSERVDE